MTVTKMAAQATVLEPLDDVLAAMTLSPKDMNLSPDDGEDGSPPSASKLRPKNLRVVSRGRPAVAREAPAMDSGDAYSTEFWKSALNWARIQHQRPENVGALIGVCTKPLPPFVAREYYANGTLLDFLLDEDGNAKEGDSNARQDFGRRGGGRSGDATARVILVWRLLREAAEELAFLHHLGIVHGNLKPNNVLVDDGEHAKLVDICGLPGGEWRWEDDAENHTDKRWLAPELIGKDDETNWPPECSKESDVYALGKCSREIIERVHVGSVLHEDLLYRMCDTDAANRPTAQQVVMELTTPSPGQNKPKNVVTAVRSIIRKLDPVHCVEKFTYNDVERPVYDRIADLQEQLDSDRAQAASAEPFMRCVWAVLQRYLLLLRARRKQLEQQRKRKFCSVVCALALRRWVERYWDLHTEIDAIVAMSAAHFELSSEMHHSWKLSCNNIRDQYAREVVTAVSDFAQTYCAKCDKTEPESEDERTPTELLHAALMTCRYELERGRARYTEEEHENMARVRATLEEHEALREMLQLPPWFVPSYEVLHTDKDKELGKGSFAEARRTTWNSTSVVVKIQVDDQSEAKTHAPKESYLSESSCCSEKARPATTDGITKKKEAAPDKKAELIGEADLWFRLLSPRLVQLFGACHVASRLFVCELADHGSLDKYLVKREENGNRVEHDERWKLLYQAALGLRYLHHRGIAHGDLKCNNIVVGRDGKAKLCDFGLNFEPGTFGKSKGLPPAAAGAYPWKAPERLVSETHTNAPDLLSEPSEWLKSDVFSLAMCFIEAATGEPPFGRDVPGASAKVQIVNGKLPLCPADFSNDEWALVLRMTAYKPVDRPSMDVVVHHLETIVPSVLSWS